SMQSTDTYRQPWPLPEFLAASTELYKESKLKLSLEVRNCSDVIVIHCQGRIVYRDEALALSRMVSEFLQTGNKVILDLSGVISMDSAGIGELVLLHIRANSLKAEMKYASPSPLVRELLGLTNLDSVLEVHPSLSDALAAFQPAEACADC
ncbi:MAG: STAS domain-containing protein, partial [Candidatus Sulfotelmatobacter sp.]